MEDNHNQKIGFLSEGETGSAGVLISTLVKVTEQFLATVNSLNQVSDIKSRQDKLVSVMEHYDRLNMVVRVLKLTYPVILENPNEKETINFAIRNTSASAINSLSKIKEHQQQLVQNNTLQLTNTAQIQQQHIIQRDTPFSVNDSPPDQQQVLSEPPLNNQLQTVRDTSLNQQHQVVTGNPLNQQPLATTKNILGYPQETIKKKSLDHPQQLIKKNPLNHQQVIQNNQQDGKINVLGPRKIHLSKDIQSSRDRHTQKDIESHQPLQTQKLQMVGRAQRQTVPVPKEPEYMEIDSAPATKVNAESINISSNVFLDQFENTARTFAAQNKMELSDVWESLFVHALPQDKIKWAENTILHRSLNWNTARKYYLKAFPDIHVQTPFKQFNHNEPPTDLSTSATQAATRVNDPVTPVLQGTMDEKKRMIERHTLYAERLLSLEMKSYDTIYDYNKKFHRYSIVACMNLNDASLSKRYITSLVPKYRLLVEKALANKPPAGLIETMKFAERLIQAQGIEHKKIQRQVCWKHPNQKKRTSSDDNLMSCKRSSCA
ncbi:hypothetical protein INT47_004464 [Mucor saturninus]|uniref:Uncharacterized protein n=1 Tax=Mucor saturninus TaxID=64648 RepID=A0A8H7QU74_9FUNG|nr:hypothetical protein INT47_004464 [Mucor saturninus]